MAETEAQVKEIGVDCISIKADVSNNDQVKAMFDKLIEHYGRIDILVNNAGVCPVELVFDVTPESFARTMEINVNSMFICAHHAIPYMVDREWGRIINAASTGAFTQSPLQLSYCTSKWAVRGLTRQLAAPLAPMNITVNAYCPGATYTPMQEKILEQQQQYSGMDYDEFIAWKKALTPSNRWIKEEEIASLVSYLASEEASAITGSSILVDGGFIMN